MQKDDRYYTFLFTKSSRSKIYIRRIEVSKKWLHTCAASAVLSVSLATAGLGIAMNSDGVQAKSVNLPETSPVAQISAVQSVKNEVKPINYERPTISPNLNMGGPSSPFQLSNVGNETEENELETLLLNIERTSNPEFLPTMWAHMGKINNEYGFRRNPFGGRSL